MLGNVILLASSLQFHFVFATVFTYLEPMPAAGATELRKLRKRRMQIA